MDLFNQTNRNHDPIDQLIIKQNREQCYGNIFKHQNIVNMKQDDEEILNETMKFVQKNIEKVLLDSDVDESNCFHRGAGERGDNDEWSTNLVANPQHSYFGDQPSSMMVMKGNNSLPSLHRSLNPLCGAGPPAPPAYLYHSNNNQQPPPSSPPKSPLWVRVTQRGGLFQKPNKNNESTGYQVGCGGDVFEVHPTEQPNKDQKSFLKPLPPPLSSPVAFRKQANTTNFQSTPILRMKKTSRFNWILNEMILKKFPALMKIDFQNNVPGVRDESEQRHQAMDGFQNPEQQPLDQQQDGGSKYLLQFTEKMFSDYLKICAFELKKLEQEIDELIDGIDSNYSNHHPQLNCQIPVQQNRIGREITDNAKQKWCSSSMNQMDLFVWNLFELHEKLSSLINHNQPSPSQSSISIRQKLSSEAFNLDNSSYNPGNAGNIPITKMIDVWYQIVEQIKNDLVNGDHNFNGSGGVPGSPDFYHQQRQDQPDSRIGFMETNLDPQPQQYYYQQQQQPQQQHPYSVNPYHQYNHHVVHGFGGGQFGSQSLSTMVADSSNNNNHGQQNNHKSIIMHLKLLWRMTRHIRTSLWIVFLVPKIQPNAYKNQQNHPTIIGSDSGTNTISTTTISIDSSVNNNHQQQSSGNTVWNNPQRQHHSSAVM